MARSKSYRVKRRLNDREAKRRARIEYLDELASLRSTIKDLKSTLQALVCKPVQWQDIAVEMQNAAQSSQAINHQLRHHVEYTRSLVCQLRDWVETMRPTSLVTRLSAITWYDVGLEHDPELRRIALDWISKQLLHSTEVHICPSIFPHSSEDLIKAEWGQQGRKLVLQKVFNATPEQLAKALWISNQASSKHSLQPSIDNTNRYVQILFSSNTEQQRMCYVREESHTAQGLSIVHLLHICVFEPDRIVVAYRSISHDADFEPWDQHESIQEWNEIRYLGDGRSVLRAVHITEPRNVFSSITDYIKTLYPAIYADAIKNYTPAVNEIPPLEQYLRRAMLANGIVYAKNYLTYLDEMVAYVVTNNPTC